MYTKIFGLKKAMEIEIEKCLTFVRQIPSKFCGKFCKDSSSPRMTEEIQIL